MIVHRQKFKTCKVLEVYWIFVVFNKIFMGSVFLGHPVWCILSADTRSIVQTHTFCARQVDKNIQNRTFYNGIGG